MIDARHELPSSTAARSSRRADSKSSRRTVPTASEHALKIERVFSTASIYPSDMIKWEKRTAEITDDSGKVIFKQENVEVPKSWSVLATKVVVSKYYYGEKNTPERETSVKQLIHRVCRTIADWGVKDGYFSEEDGAVFSDELTWLCANQYGAFNSPVWFNVGLFHQYGVGKNSAKGNWYFNRKSGQGERASTQYEYPQGSACFIQSVEDNMEDIMRLAHSEAMLFKYGSGTGTDLSPIRSSDQFMQAAIDGKEWWTRSVTTGQPLQKKEASKLLDKIAEGTWICGDPGLQYDGAIQNWHTCKGTEPIHSTNPCSEYVFLNNTACNLASLNLMKFKRDDGQFDLDRFKAAIRIFITAQEIVVDNASYPTKWIAENSHTFRTLGLGYANLGSLIMSYGLPYDSDDGRALAGAITAIMTGHAYERSAEIAGTMGPFQGYHDARCAHVDKPLAKDNVESMLGVIQLHRESVEKIQPSREFNYLKEEARKCWDRVLALGRQQGYRNAQVTVLAPTGTIAFLMDCDTTGVEPDIALVKYKLLAGGGMLKIVNRTLPQARQRLGYNRAEMHKIIGHSEKFDASEDAH